MIGSSISYAAGNVYARHNVRGLRPMVQAFFQVFFALVIVTILAFAFERPFALNWTGSSIFAVVWLGLLGSGLAYLCFFWLLARWGSTRSSMVAYLLPVVGIVLGFLVLTRRSTPGSCSARPWWSAEWRWSTAPTASAGCSAVTHRRPSRRPAGPARNPGRCRCASPRGPDGPDEDQAGPDRRLAPSRASTPSPIRSAPHADAITTELSRRGAIAVSGAGCTRE